MHLMPVSSLLVCLTVLLFALKKVGMSSAWSVECTDLYKLPCLLCTVIMWSILKDIFMKLPSLSQKYCFYLSTSAIVIVSAPTVLMHQWWLVQLYLLNGNEAAIGSKINLCIITVCLLHGAEIRHSLQYILTERFLWHEI